MRTSMTSNTIVDQLTAPTGYEGLAPLKKRKLKEHAAELAELGTWFGDQRHLDYDTESLPEYAGLSESLSKAGKTISSRIRSLREGEQDVAAPPELGAAQVIDVAPSLGDDES